MKILNTSFIIIFSLFLPFLAVGKVIITKDVTSINSIEEKASLYIDTTNQVTLAEIKNGNNRFEPFSNNHSILEAGQTYWLKINVKNKQTQTINWVFNLRK